MPQRRYSESEQTKRLNKEYATLRSFDFVHQRSGLDQSSGEIVTASMSSHEVQLAHLAKMLVAQEATAAHSPLRDIIEHNIERQFGSAEAGFDVAGISPEELIEVHDRFVYIHTLPLPPLKK